jgi:hypothetical protein
MFTIEFEYPPGPGDGLRLQRWEERSPSVADAALILSRAMATPSPDGFEGRLSGRLVALVPGAKFSGPATGSGGWVTVRRN